MVWGPGCREVGWGGVGGMEGMRGVRVRMVAHHFFAYLHGRREGLGVTAQDVAKVNVEEAAVVGEHEVVQVPVPHAQDVGHHAVARTAAHKRLNHLHLQAKWTWARGGGIGGEGGVERR